MSHLSYLANLGAHIYSDGSIKFWRFGEKKETETVCKIENSLHFWVLLQVQETSVKTVQVKKNLVFQEHALGVSRGQVQKWSGSQKPWEAEHSGPSPSHHYSFCSLLPSPSLCQMGTKAAKHSHISTAGKKQACLPASPIQKSAVGKYPRLNPSALQH